MNEIFLVYLWGIYEQVGVTVSMLIAVIIFYTLLAGIIGAMFKDTTAKGSEAYEVAVKAHKSIKPVLVLLLVLVMAKTFTPSRNVAVMMVSAPTIIKLAKEASESDSINRINNILENSLIALEKKSKELAKVSHD